ncbi:ATP-binding protein [Halovenus sp. HT40]|uniref:ATP-binding protein n=1 Tax=Halovenus sp. HT40 TaxID=3126691 RepID=UPI00300ED964
MIGTTALTAGIVETETTITVSRLLLIAASVGLLGAAVRTARTATGPVGQPFLALLGLLSATALCLGVTAGSGTANKLIWLGTNLTIPVALLAVSCRYYGIALFSSRARTAGVLVPLGAGAVGSLLLILGTPAKTPGAAAPLELLAGLPPLVFDAAVTFDRVGRYYTAALVLVAVGIVAVNVLRYEHLDTRLAAALAFVGGWPWLGNFVVPELGAAYGDGAAISVLAGGYLVSVAVAGLVIGPLRLFESSPAAGNIGPERALDSMADAVIITDAEGRVLRLNAVAREIFGMTAAESVGQPLPAVVGRQESELDTESPVEIETTDGTRQFAVTRSPVRNGGTTRGTVYVLRDVTRRQNREQRLEVLNRVLRHNLRNDATSIIGRAQLISEGDGGEDSAQAIIETTRDLVGVAESARDIESMMAATGSQRAVDVEPIVQRVIDDIGSAYPGVELTTAVPADATVAASERVLETVLTELVENAAKHNDTSEPFVVVSVEQSRDGSAVIAVSDNGPGVPEHERAVLDSGGEDQLEHGSGLGLWAVHWGVTQIGGTLSITENTPRGTTVAMTMPTAANSHQDTSVSATS